MKERYAVVKGSQSAHCCFKATVVDTTRPDLAGAVQHNAWWDAMALMYHEQNLQLPAAQVPDFAQP